MLPSWLNAIPIKAKNRITFMAADWRPALELFLLYRTHHVYQIYLISYLCCIIQDFRLVARARDSHGDLYSSYYSPVQVYCLLTKTWEIRLDHQLIWLLLSSIELLVHPSYYMTQKQCRLPTQLYIRNFQRCANLYTTHIIQFLINVTVSLYDFIQILDVLCEMVTTWYTWLVYLHKFIHLIFIFSHFDTLI